MASSSADPLHDVASNSKRKFATALLLALFAACSPQSSSVIAKLRISEAAAYELDGQPVERAALAASIGAKRVEGRSLVVHIAAAPLAPSEAVLYATKVCQEAGAALAFVGNERF